MSINESVNIVIFVSAAEFYLIDTSCLSDHIYIKFIRLFLGAAFILTELREMTYVG